MARVLARVWVMRATCVDAPPDPRAQVRYTRGALLWSVTYSAGRLLDQSNVASQDFDPAARTATNMAEYGRSVSVSASGTYAPLVCACHF